MDGQNKKSIPKFVEIFGMTPRRHHVSGTIGTIETLGALR